MACVVVGEGADAGPLCPGTGICPQDSGVPSLHSPRSHVSPFKHPVGPQSLCLKQPTTLVRGPLWVWQRPMAPKPMTPRPWAGEIGRAASSGLASFPRERRATMGPGLSGERSPGHGHRNCIIPTHPTQRTSVVAFGVADICPDPGAHDQGEKRLRKQSKLRGPPIRPLPGVSSPAAPTAGNSDEVTAAPDRGQASPETVSLSAKESSSTPAPHSPHCWGMCSRAEATLAPSRSDLTDRPPSHRFMELPSGRSGFRDPGISLKCPRGFQYPRD